MHLEHLARNYERLLVTGLVLTPAMMIAYLAGFSDPTLKYVTHGGHELAILVAVGISGFIAYVSWCSYRASGEVFLRWLTAGFIAFTLIYVMHGLLTRTAHHNILLFLLYGPVSRLVMIGCIFVGLLKYGLATEDPQTVRQQGFWRRLFVWCGVVVLAVPVLAYAPFATQPWVRLSLEGGAILLCLVALGMMFWRQIRSPLMMYYAAAMAIFVQAAIAFILGRPWNTMWWFAHFVFAGGFFILSWGVVRALLTTRSFANAYSQEQLVQQLRDEKQRAERAEETSREAAEFNRQVIDGAQEGIIVYGPDKRYQVWNPFMEHITGLQATEVLGRHPLELFPFLEDGGVMAGLELALTGRTPEVAEFAFEIPQSGRAGWVVDRTAPLRNSQGKIIGALATVTDITERREAEAELKRYREHLEDLVRERTAELTQAPLGIWMLDREGVVIECNDKFAEYAGAPKEKIIGFNMLADKHDISLKEPIQRALAGETVVIETAYTSNPGERASFYRFYFKPVWFDGHFAHLQCFAEDISERKRAEDELRKMATTDFLTGLSNRRCFIDRLKVELARFHRAVEQPASLLLLDFDHFKNINDRFGHAAGDELLKHFARLIEEELRRIDIAGRLGGEEFGIILSGANQEAAVIFAKRLCRRVADSTISVGAEQIRYTVSIGVTLLSAVDILPEMVLARADKALYKAKGLGRNRVEVACVDYT